MYFDRFYIELIYVEFYQNCTIKLFVFSQPTPPTVHDVSDDSQRDEHVSSAETKDKNEVMMYIPKLKHCTHFFEYTDQELNELIETNKSKEVLLLRSTDTIEQVMGDESSVDCLFDEALSCSVIPPLAQSRELKDEGMIHASVLEKSEERIKRLEAELDARTKQYAQLHQMYLGLQQKLANVLVELKKQR